MLIPQKLSSAHISETHTRTHTQTLIRRFHYRNYAIQLEVQCPVRQFWNISALAYVSPDSKTDCESVAILSRRLLTRR